MKLPPIYSNAPLVIVVVKLVRAQTPTAQLVSRQ